MFTNLKNILSIAVAASLMMVCVMLLMADAMFILLIMTVVMLRGTAQYCVVLRGAAWCCVMLLGAAWCAWCWCCVVLRGVMRANIHVYQYSTRCHPDPMPQP